MNNFQNLKVWQKARLFTKEAYLVLNKLPNDERFGLTSQLKRAVISISSNIAEGSGRNSDADFTRFLDISLGSCYEVESQFTLAMDLNFINEQDFNLMKNSINEIEKMLIGLIKSKRNK